MALLSRREQKLGYKIREDTVSRVMCRKFCALHRRGIETAELPRAKRVGNGCARRSLPVELSGMGRVVNRGAEYRETVHERVGSSCHAVICRAKETHARNVPRWRSGTCDWRRMWTWRRRWS